MGYNSVRIEAPEGQMVVSRERTSVGYIVRCPKEYEHLYELMSEEEALALEEQWKAEKEAERKANEQPKDEGQERPQP